MLRNRRGFTLIELIVVITIVGILSAVAIPMMSGNIATAKRSEAIAAAGGIRTALKCLKAEGITITSVGAGSFGGTSNMNNYIKTGDLNGKYYNDSCYALTSSNVIVTAGMDSSPAVKLDQNGNTF